MPNISYKIFFTIGYIFLLSYSNAQDSDLWKEKKDSLISFFNQIKNTNIDKKRLIINNEISDILLSLINDPQTPEIAYDSIPNLGKLISSDKRIKIFNWNLVFDDGSFKYFGIVQYFSKNRKKYQVFVLNDRKKDINEPEHATLSNETWYGALYYQIIEKSYWGKKYYFLLGWDGFDDLRNRKIIDVFYFSGSGNPKFGAPVFYNENKQEQRRIIFEFANRSSMALSFDIKKDLIIFDHLSPSNTSLKGLFQYYGPDGSYDALKFKKGKWHYIIDIDARNPKPLKKPKK
ncbi:MAG: hypothetical protein A2275_01135 [Bacteroidetes bacterium RIFOXYA12_FULL_35_11]|nr:MAG: hypothetical protein A2X01_03970 [Bacteroidetes bacterium GWF2_35_48]OFY78421.1 MAG: hypothetical protein A2275_01135 [Bacteroidetes bacterium RIFOXYA12_FULL_35_11]OFY93488.1 MAG: hypothetical protein A2491_10905 [Bacteroidetes bacterium RIFOXYC12_FULL_35_7]HBX50862.1 hypothetical protein [Bacteroidales bacterium]